MRRLQRQPAIPCRLYDLPLPRRILGCRRIYRAKPIGFLACVRAGVCRSSSSSSIVLIIYAYTCI